MAGQLERHRHKYDSGRFGEGQPMGLTSGGSDSVTKQLVIQQYHLHVQCRHHKAYLMLP